MKKVPRRSNQSAGNGSAARPPAGTAARIPRAGDKQQPPANRRRAGSSRGKRKNVFGKYLGHFKNTGLLFKKSLRNLILYPVAILALYPLLVFKHIYFMILYLFLWTNIVLGVAIFLDELFDLPRKR